MIRWVHCTPSDDDESETKVPRLSPDIKLLPHQRKGLAWFRRVEKRHLPTGGLLADDMGLGKTLQTLAFVVHRQQRLPRSRPTSPSPAAKPSLSSSSPQQREVDEQAITLVILPLSLLRQWEVEIRRLVRTHEEGVLVYRGPRRERLLDEQQLREQSVWIILTTLETVQSDARKAQTRQQDNGNHLFSRSWYRLVVDEAHMIRSGNAPLSEAVRALKSERRWALSGTPYNNHQSDLVALCQYISVQPFCRPQWWKTQATPLLRRRAWDRWRRRHFLRRTKDDLTAHLAQCHLHRHILRFPPQSPERLFLERLMVLHRQDLMEFRQIEREHLSLVVPASRELEHRTENVLRLLIRMRQTCNHPFQTLGRGWTRHLLRRAVGPLLIEDDLPTLDQLIQQSIVSQCGDECEKPCATRDQWWTGRDRLLGESLWMELSSCRRSAAFANSSVSMPYTLRPTVKMAWLMRHLQPWLTGDGRRKKVVVFSQWGAALDLIEYFCIVYLGHRPLRFDGQLKHVDDRQRVLDQFQIDPRHPILLCSLRCGAVGLNLTVADCVVLFDIWYNPMVEEQALNRVHRLGQTSDHVHVHRLLIHDSIEENVARIQARKTAESRLLVPTQFVWDASSM